MSRPLLPTAFFLVGLAIAGCSDTAESKEADAGSLADAAASFDAGATGPFVFVSSTVASGDSMINASGLCQELADNAGLGGNFVAWTSTAAADAIDLVQGNGPWHLTTGEVAFADAASLATGPSRAINRNEHGEEVGESLVFTGTDAEGIYTGEACKGWTSYYDYSDATVGSVDSAAAWTASEVVHCGRPRRFYCFEVE